MDFNLFATKWGAGRYGTPGGDVTWSSDLSDLSFDEDVYTTSDFVAAIGGAFDAWQSYADIEFTQVATGGDIQFDTAEIGGRGIALASWREIIRDDVNGFTTVDIDFNDDLTWSPQGDDGVDFEATALHEIGHAIGLGHVEDSDQIMYAEIYGGSLGQGDITGAQVIYGPAIDAPLVADLPDAVPDPVEPGEIGPDDGDSGPNLGVIGLVAGLVGGLLGLFFGGGDGGGGGTNVAAAKAPETPTAEKEPTETGPATPLPAAVVDAVGDPEADGFLL